MGNNSGILYTIGYSGFNIKGFVDVLQKMKIRIVIDVRSYPVSKYYPDYNKDLLEETLKNNRIIYKNYSAEFGARQEQPLFFSKEGYLDFSKFVMSEQFKTGFDKIVAGLDAGFNFALLCAEKKPSMCHRTIMIARQFFKNGIDVRHILPDKSLITQLDIEDELIMHYFPNNNQLSLLSEPLPKSELIEKAYQLRNAEIGFKEEGGD